MIHADGTGARQLTDLPGQVEGPVFSPDGTRIAFSEQQYEDPRQSWIRVVGADGSGLVDAAT